MCRKRIRHQHQPSDPGAGRFYSALMENEAPLVARINGSRVGARVKLFEIRAINITVPGKAILGDSRQPNTKQ
jgi:hypothetical protein